MNAILLAIGIYSIVSIYILIGLTVPVIIGSVLICKYVDPFPNYLLMVALQTGIVAGALLWRV